jgi:hypothetical protein
MRNIASSEQWQQTTQQYTLLNNLTWQQPSHFGGSRSIVAALVNVVVDLDDNFPLRQVVCGHVHDLFETLHKCVVIPFLVSFVSIPFL